jgi:hypothetical protein
MRWPVGGGCQMEEDYKDDMLFLPPNALIVSFSSCFVCVVSFFFVFGFVFTVVSPPLVYCRLCAFYLRDSTSPASISLLNNRCKTKQPPGNEEDTRWIYPECPCPKPGRCMCPYGIICRAGSDGWTCPPQSTSTPQTPVTLTTGRYCECSCDVHLCSLHSVHATLTINMHLHTLQRRPIEDLPNAATATPPFPCTIVRRTIARRATARALGRCGN